MSLPALLTDATTVLPDRAGGQVTVDDAGQITYHAFPSFVCHDAGHDAAGF